MARLKVEHVAALWCIVLLGASLCEAKRGSRARAAAAGLSLDHYNRTCPDALKIIRDTVVDKQISHPTTAAGALRLLFHDCFVTGCDASVLITSTQGNEAERDADINRSLPGDAFDVVMRAKTALELTCPGVVSCADILAVAARDLVTMLGGPYYQVHLGRLDSLSSSASSVEGHLPRPTMPVPELSRLFAANGFSEQEMVALIGAHTVGFSHCSEFAPRIYGYGKSGGAAAHDPSLNPSFAQGLQKACADYNQNPAMSVFNDVITPSKFDNMYYRNLPRGLGLLQSDQAIYADARTRPFVDAYSANETAFFRDFVRAMEKLGFVGVKTSRLRGEIRRRCDRFNSNPF